MRHAVLPWGKSIEKEADVMHERRGLSERISCNGTWLICLYLTCIRIHTDASPCLVSVFLFFFFSPRAWLTACGASAAAAAHRSPQRTLL
jgi:hypothetical protein